MLTVRPPQTPLHPSLAEPHPMTCGHSPLPPSRCRSFGRGAQCRNLAYCSPTTSPSATPRSTRAASARERGRCAAPGVRSRHVSSANKLLNLSALCTPRSTSVASARERGGRDSDRGEVTHRKQRQQAVEPAHSATPRSTSVASARERGRCAAPGVRSFTVSSTGKLMNLRTLPLAQRA